MQIIDNNGIFKLCFHIQARFSSYVMGVTNEGHLLHLYYGKALAQNSISALLQPEYSPWYPPEKGQPLLDKIPLEYPVSGMADLRPCALSVLWDDQDNTSDLRYLNHTIISGKPKPQGLPCVYTEREGEAQTLEIELYDRLKGLSCKLYYTVLSDHNAIMRRVVLKNKGEASLTITRAMSACVDFNFACPKTSARHRLLHLHGAWIDEFTPEYIDLKHCTYTVSSFKGASGHEHNPFGAVLDAACTEENGEVYGLSLIYSGNFKLEADVSYDDKLRLNMGISDTAFSWKLSPGESFYTPEAVLVYSHKGLGDLSRTYHRLYETRLCRGKWRDCPRPVLLNTWEGVYFDFNSEKLLKLARMAADAGVELFVLDDGWFGRRNSEKSSLGDWYVNEEKLGCSLDELASDINDLNMNFGIWVEPEMVSPDSQLFRDHPDWALSIAGRERTQARHQLILDLTRADVREYIIMCMSNIFSCANISYVKWDMNRNMSEVGSHLKTMAGELPHRYILGLYEILETLTQKFPNILFESCASGGGRFDPGMLYYMPQGWLSDNTDAISRLKIQYGASFVYSPLSMGAHISSVPNHQVWRSTPMNTRFNVALAGGSFGYELDITKLSSHERDEIKKQISQYKALRDKRIGAKLYRIGNPVTDNDTGWMFVGEKSADLTIVRQMGRSQSPECVHIRLSGLNEQDMYKLSYADGTPFGSPEMGSVLMTKGLYVTMPLGDFVSVRINLEKL